MTPDQVDVSQGGGITTHYDLKNDTLTINGVVFSGELIRAGLTAPTPKGYVWRTERDSRGKLCYCRISLEDIKP